ncbi:MAG TPA: NAD-dependent epimerase/dehydratase family protein [Baekduia sp.]|uniref:NAD-dependent epimerase/dehydratase family protein n=1 Tax=Baekduia sp. TaxID=2600305 RepID=UPI002CA99789|nr:NAD-dependent epimerase/dehydratase family protein [Baekduia sp.]HMJ36465.1 NAD-dependent epimerase/dehydratase family protein [Baekduia sp.]
MRALVTGGAGFIGSNLVDALLAQGAEVDIVDTLVTGRRSNLEAGALERGARLHEIDITDAPALNALVADAAPEVIFHLAAQIDVRKSIDDPALDASVNVVGTINVLEAARRAGVRRVVNTSTGGAIYGDAQRIPSPEDETPLPMAAYGQSKFCAERYLGWYGRLYDQSNVTLRLGNVYGPRQDPLGEAGVIAIFCGKVKSGEAPTIYGDGSQTRDYVYVGDVVRAQLAAGQSDITGEVNVGTGRESSVLDIVAVMKELVPEAARTFDPRFEDARLGEIDRSCLDVTRARDALGFEAQTSLRDGLRATLEATL